MAGYDAETQALRAALAESSSVLFERAVPVALRSGDKEDRVEELTVRVSMGVSKQFHNSKLLRVQLTSENDPFFLHTMEVTEEDFQTLKVEQSILVDFGTFPSKLIELFEETIRCREQEAALPRFHTVLRLAAGPADSQLSVVETNAFKALTHLALRFRPGNDAVVKQYLATRLFEVRSERDRLRGLHELTSRDLERTREQEASARAQLAHERDGASRLTAELRAEHAQQLAEARERSAAEMAEAAAKAEAERARVRDQYQAKVDAAEERCAQLAAQVRSLSDGKYALDVRVSELSAKLGSADGELSAARAELARLREANRQLDAASHEAGKTVQGLQVKLGSAEQSLHDHKELLQAARERTEAAEAHKEALEATLADARAAAQRAEERSAAAAAEAQRMAALLEQSQSELKAAKAKSKAKAALVQQQEQLLVDKAAALDRAQREASEARREAGSAQLESRSLAARVEDQRRKLEESQQLLVSNQQMIQWLNQQVNEAQLGKLGLSNRYTFKPSAAPAAAGPTAGVMSNQALASSVAVAAAGLVAAATGGGRPAGANAGAGAAPASYAQSHPPPSPSAYRPGVVTYRPKSVNGSQELPAGALKQGFASNGSTAPASPITPERG